MEVLYPADRLLLVAVFRKIEGYIANLGFLEKEILFELDREGRYGRIGPQYRRRREDFRINQCPGQLLLDHTLRSYRYREGQR